MGTGLLVIHDIHWRVINKASLMIDCSEMPTESDPWDAKWLLSFSTVIRAVVWAGFSQCIRT